MARKRIFCVGFDLPGDQFEYIEFDSDQSLLDADIVLFEPSFGAHWASEQYQGERLFDHSTSVQVAKNLQHWRSELALAVNAGKLVVVYLTKPLVYHRYTGQQGFSGTGRSRVTTNFVAEIASYSAVPKVKSAEAKTGREVRLTRDGAFLSGYWKEFGEQCQYEAFIDGQFGKIVLTTKTGGKTVGAVVEGKGVLLFLPPVRYDEKKFTKHDAKKDQTFWTTEAVQFGKRLAAALAALSDTLLAGSVASPPPSWVADIKFRLPQEARLEGDIATIAASIENLQRQRETIEQELQDAGACRALLYEQGKPLERAVVEALATLGFVAKRYAEGESEFDVVFEAPEGRCLGEVEGKDSKAINVDKFNQLERNLQEDFARDDVHEYAKGVLFGNAERLTTLDARSDAFTVKCMSAAKRAHVALVRTSDLFDPVRYLKTHSDSEYAAACRKEIFGADGEVVRFPVPPVSAATDTECGQK
jgi:hypothetical protein